MKISDFKLERYFGKHEFTAQYLLCASDCESFNLKDILSKKDVSKILSLRLGYTEPQGSLSLRKEISKLFQKVGPEEIVVSGTGEGIFITMNVLLDAGDRVIVQYPCYQSLFELPKAIGCKVIKWEPEMINNQWHWDVQFLREKMNEKIKLMVITSPHNPTGHLFTKREYQKIMEIAKENNCYVFSDEMYRLLEYNSKDRLPPGSDIYEKCISLFGMSKTFGLGGLRLGWLSIREKDLLNKIIAFKDYTSVCNNVLSEYTAFIALRKKNTLVSRNLKIIKRNLKLLDGFFSKHSDKFTWIKPRAGPISLVKINFNKNTEDFCEDVVNRKGVMLMPSTKFDYGNNYFRIGFGRENMPEALEIFEEYINKNL